jgi:hypothetical protein
MRATSILTAFSIAALIVACNREGPTAASTLLTPNADMGGDENWVFTTYYWEDGGWVRHAQWDASFLKPELQVLFMASNWLRDHPEFEASFDNFYAYGDITEDMPQGLVDDFDGIEIGDVWGGTGEQCVEWEGAAACQDDKVIVHIGSGVEPGAIRRVAGLATWDYVLDGEFDVRIEFSLNDDYNYHSLRNAYVTLAVVDDRQYSASIQIRSRLYESVERGGWGLEDYFRPINRSPTNHLDGKLRITRTRVWKGNGIVESVTGGGSWGGVEQGDDWSNFSFTARRHDDRTVNGQWQWIHSNAGSAAESKSHGVVTCFAVVGDEAWLGGYTTSGSYSDPPNNGITWRVKDNGQGAGDPADQISLESIGVSLDLVANHCANKSAALELSDLQTGDIQIRYGRGLIGYWRATSGVVDGVEIFAGTDLSVTLAFGSEGMYSIWVSGDVDRLFCEDASSCTLSGEYFHTSTAIMLSEGDDTDTEYYTISGRTLTIFEEGHSLTFVRI